jgi:multiple sugar transport system substrate-binding protein
MVAQRFGWGLLRSAALLMVIAALTGCQGSGKSQGVDAASRSSGAGNGAGQLEFWHTRTQDQQKQLQGIVTAFNAAHPGTTIKPQYQGNYQQLFQKVTVSIQTKQLPALAVAYESMIAEYMAADIVVPLDPLISNPQIGLSQQDLADIFPAYLASNRFPRYKNQLLSFPFTKSNLVMYYNRDRLKQAGLAHPPATWDEFLAQCRAVSAKTRKPAWALALDPSTIDGIIFSYGGELLSPDQQSTRFDQPPTVKMLSLIDRAITQKLAYQTSNQDLQNDFANQNATFILTTSNAQSFLDRQVAGKFDWDLAIIPHETGVKPVTVMYGANICLFRSEPVKERAAWEFVKYFTSKEVTARWATESGYLPVRKSALTTETVKQFAAQHPRFRRAVDMLPSARPEPNIAGWQEVRDLLNAAVTSVITQTAEPPQAAQNLKQKADRVIKPR